MWAASVNYEFRTYAILKRISVCCYQTDPEKLPLPQNFIGLHEDLSLLYREKFWDDVVTIWTGNPPAPAGLTLSQFVEQYQDLGYAVSHYMPEKMKGLNFLMSYSIKFHHSVVFFSPITCIYNDFWGQSPIPCYLSIRCCISA